MIRRLAVALVLASALLAAPIHTGAQVSGVAFVAYSPGGIRDNNVFFLGPWRATPTGMEVLYTVMCIDTTDATKKVVGEAVAAYPNGSSLAEMRTLLTTAIVNFCGSAGTPITVPRGAVILPQIAFGQ